jgi:uncharacterized protein (TIGR02594 family)
VRLILVILLLLASCTTPNPLVVAEKQIGLNEQTDRKELINYMDGWDPYYNEWCAAFINAVLRESNIANLIDMNHPNPYLARSFLDWGETVTQPRAGDIVIFPRGNKEWQGHVGFYVGSKTVRDIDYYLILGGNQNDSVSIDLYPTKKAIGIRRYKYTHGTTNHTPAT